MTAKIATLERLSPHSTAAISQAFGAEPQYIDRNALAGAAESDCDVLICRDRDDWDEIFRIFSNLRFVFILSVGVEKLPFAELSRRGITVACPSGINAGIMSDYAMGAILAHSTRLVENIDNQRRRHWKKFQCVDPLEGKTLMIVGAGHVGKCLALKARGFGMRVIGIKKHICEVEGFDVVTPIEHMDTYLPEADFIVVTIPLTPETHRIFDARRFDVMRRDAVFINISRSRIVDTEALVDALKEHKIKAAVIDVFDSEPLQAASEMWGIEGLILTPHSSGRLADFVDHTMPYFIANLKAYINGEPLPNRVNLSDGY